MSTKVNKYNLNAFKYRKNSNLRVRKVKYEWQPFVSEPILYPGYVDKLKAIIKEANISQHKIAAPEATAFKIHAIDSVDYTNYLTLPVSYPDLHKVWPNISFENFQHFLNDKRK